MDKCLQACPKHGQDIDPNCHEECFGRFPHSGGKPRKSPPSYVKTNKTYVGRDGVKRCVFIKGSQTYVKKRDSKTGKMVYRIVTLVQ